MSAAVTGWLAEALIASTLLMVFVLTVRKAAQRSLGAQLAYWLWALPALRMAMPPLPASWRESAAAPISAASETVMVLFDPVIATSGEPTALPWLAMAAAAWALGALGFFVWHGLAHLSYVRRILAPPAQHVQLPDGTTLVASDEAIGPVAFGVLKRFVAVPSDFAERYDADERKLALAHELGHHARGDLIANWAALAMLAAHWFNPIAWVAYRKFRGDQEMANDARVLAALPPIERHTYACAIVKAAHGRAVTAACHLHTIEDLKGRLRMLKASRKSRRVLMAGAVGIASLTVAGLGLTASGAAAEKIRAVAETHAATLTEAAALTQTDPASPEPPVAPGVERKKKVVVVRDGKTETYEGADADAYLAANPDVAAQAYGARSERRHRIAIRDKAGNVRTYEGAEADAYLKAHRDMRPPAPPVPPGPPAVPVPGMAIIQPGESEMVVMTNPDGRMTTRRMTRRGSDGYALTAGISPEIITGECRGRDAQEFVRQEVKNGKQRMIICQRRIERFADAQARSATRTARFSQAQARASRQSALAGLIAGRVAIERTQGLTEEQRAQALAGIEAARIELEGKASATTAD